MNMFMLKEAITSTALSHPEKCDCRTCRAAKGDMAMMTELMAELFLAGEEGGS